MKLKIQFDYFSDCGALNFHLDSDTSVLRKDMHSSQRSAFVAGTWTNLRTQFFTFILFCRHFHLSYLPASLDTVMLFAQFLSRSFKAPQSIRNYLNGVKFVHVMFGYEYNFHQDTHFKLLFRGIQRNMNHVPKRAAPISPDILQRISSVLDFGSDLDIVCWTAGLFLFFLMARAGNVFQDSKDISIGLRRKDVLFSDQYLFVKFRRTKTIQLGKRRLIIPIFESRSSICPVSACYTMLQRIAGRLSDPFFSIRSDSTLVPLSKSRFMAHFRGMMQRAEIADPHAYSCHSFRRGGDSWAFQTGLSGELIQIFGDWASDCYKLYLEMSMDTKINFATRFSSNI